MKKLFFDTNIILDFLIREEYQSNIRELIKRSSGLELYISYLTVANTAYILRKQPRHDFIKYIKLVLDIFTVIPNTYSQIHDALRIESKDFEDILQYQAAMSINCDVIITRNFKDFQFSTIPIMTVEEFLTYR